MSLLFLAWLHSNLWFRDHGQCNHASISCSSQIFVWGQAWQQRSIMKREFRDKAVQSFLPHFNFRTSLRFSRRCRQACSRWGVVFLLLNLLRLSGWLASISNKHWHSSWFMAYLPQVCNEEQVEHRSLLPVRTQKKGVPSLFMNTPELWRESGRVYWSFVYDSKW